jgi:hypothetical protein
MSGSVLFRERLAVPWWAWPACLVVSVFFALEVTMGAPQLQLPVYGGFAVLMLVGLAAASRSKVSVRAETDGAQLWVDDAHLPMSAIASVTVVDGEERRRLLGLDAEELAFVTQRPWISGGVRIDLDDPDDPTPYWFVSSRRPATLVAALEAARASAVPADPASEDAMPAGAVPVDGAAQDAAS